MHADVDAACRGTDDAHDDRWLRLAIVFAFSLALHGVLLSASGSLQWSHVPAQSLSQRMLVTLTPQRATLTAGATPAEKIANLQAANASATQPASGHAATAVQPATEEKSAAGKPTGMAYPIIPIANGLLPGPWYYPARYLHRRPSPLHPIKPEYPPQAQAIAGRVVLVLLLNEKGGVDDYRIEASEPPGIFEDAVIRAFTRETYAPGMITGYPVKSQMLVEVRFEPGEAPQTTVLPALPQ